MSPITLMCRRLRFALSPNKFFPTSGHKTRCVFDRYNIVSQDDLREAAQKRQLFNDLQERRLQNSYILQVLGEKPPKGASGILRLVSVRRDDPPQSHKQKGSADTRSANP